MRGETSTWPGSRGLRFTRANERGVVWKTYLECLVGGQEVEVVMEMGGLGGYGTCEVTVKGPNLIRELGKGGIVVGFLVGGLRECG